jgi:hypothetical protein
VEETTALDAFFESFYRQRPVTATFTGIHEYDRALPDFSPEAMKVARGEMSAMRRKLADAGYGVLHSDELRDRDGTVNDRTYAVGALMGGLEGQPALQRILLFWWYLPALPANTTRKIEISGRLRLPEPRHRVTRVNDRTYAVGALTGGLESQPALQDTFFSPDMAGFAGHIRRKRGSAGAASRPRTPTA